MKKHLRRYLFWVTPFVLVVLLIGWVATRPRPGETIADQGNQHLASMEDTHVAYNSSPPTSGPHLNQKAAWGVSDVQISDELQVHNLEDGGVIVHYNLDQIDEATKASLVSIVRRYSDKVILEPYAGFSSPIALTAWTKIDTLQAFDEARIVAFISAYRGIDHHK